MHIKIDKTRLRYLLQKVLNMMPIPKIEETLDIFNIIVSEKIIKDEKGEVPSEIVDAILDHYIDNYNEYIINGGNETYTHNDILENKQSNSYLINLKKTGNEQPDVYMQETRAKIHKKRKDLDQVRTEGTLENKFVEYLKFNKIEDIDLNLVFKNLNLSDEDSKLIFLKLSKKKIPYTIFKKETNQISYYEEPLAIVR